MGAERQISARVRGHFRSNVVGYIALFVALSGTAWAAGQITKDDIARNAVLSKHLKKGAVRAPDVATDAITGAAVAESTLGAVPRAVAADSAQTAASAQSAESAQTAQNAVNADTAGTAQTLDGLDSSDFLRSTAKASDAEKVDGADACRANVLTKSEGPSAEETVLCRFGDGRFGAFCFASGGNIRADIWIPNTSAAVYGATDAAAFAGGAGTSLLLVSASDAPGGFSTRTNAFPFYAATEAGAKIAGVMATRATATSTTTGTCNFIISATS